jgi:CheY-like chemotaxis protein
MATDSHRVVLLVQPHDDSLEMYAEFLRYEGFQALAVSDGRDALAHAGRADIVVTGIRIPGEFDGVELITRLRRRVDAKRIPIIVLTACAWQSERERAKEAGCDAFLAKPCLPSDLITEVRRLLERVER